MIPHSIVQQQVFCLAEEASELVQNLGHADMLARNELERRKQGALLQATDQTARHPAGQWLSTRLHLRLLELLRGPD